jgi:predicted dithiol-disulfide oxidoreductase (DUF899 family)
MLLEDKNAVIYGGGEAIGGAVASWTLLDLTPLGRQAEWKQSPAGRPQTPQYERRRR